MRWRILENNNEIVKKSEKWEPNRYSLINEKHKREIVLLVGSGCSWKRCRFCDYHLDFQGDKDKRREINKKVLDKVTGIYGVLEVINSGSFMELEESIEDIIEISTSKKIEKIELEAHWSRREEIEKWREKFKKSKIEISVKIGIETFDYEFRESYLMKGIPDISPKEIRKYFDDCCLLFGIPGQTKESMEQDIKIAKKYFKRVCVNIMQDNKMPIKRDKRVVDIFKNEIYHSIKDDIDVDVLLENTAFGVGGVTSIK